MVAFPVKEVMAVVVDESGQVTEVVVEALIQRTVSHFCSQVPFPEQGGLVAGFLEDLGDGDFRGKHIAEAGIASIAVALQPIVDAPAIGMASGEQGGSRWTANRMSVGLGEAYARFGERVHVGRMEIGRPVAIDVQRALVVGEED